MSLSKTSAQGYKVNMKKIIIILITYSLNSVANESIGESTVKNSKFFQFTFQCHINAPIELAEPKSWNAIIDPNFKEERETRIILSSNSHEAIIYQYIPNPMPILPVNDRYVVICGKWKPKNDFGGGVMSWSVCEYKDAPNNKNAVKVPKSDGSWLFHSNTLGGTTVTMISHTEPGSDLEGDFYVFLVNSFAGNRLPEDCNRLKRLIEK